jgi:hypothetical protein
MKMFNHAKVLLSTFTMVIAITSSAFTYPRRHASIVTSYFANESGTTTTISIGATVPIGYTRVTSTVTSEGLTAYISGECFAPDTKPCLLVAQGSQGDPQSDFAVTEVINGTFNH